MKGYGQQIQARGWDQTGGFNSRKRKDPIRSAATRPLHTRYIPPLRSRYIAKKEKENED
jgi:hypothetical protein